MIFGCSLVSITHKSFAQPSEPTSSTFEPSLILNAFEPMIRDLAKSNSAASAMLLDLQASSLHAHQSLTDSLLARMQAKYLVYLRYWTSSLLHVPQLGDSAIAVRYHDMCSTLFKEAGRILDDAGPHITGMHTMLITIAGRVAAILEDLRYLQTSDIGKLHYGSSIYGAIDKGMKELEISLSKCQTIYSGSE